MKQSISTLFLSLFLIISLSSTAQFYFGGKVGINMASLSEQPQIKEFNIDGNSAPKLGLEFGGVAMYKFSPYFSMQTEFVYARKGLKSDLLNYKFNIDTVINGEWNYSYDYIEIPLLFKASLGSKGFNPFIEFGPYYSYMVYAVQSSESFINNDLHEKDRTTGFNGFSDNEGLNRNEYGFKVGIGGAVDIKKGLIFFNLRYTHGLANVTKIPNRSNKVVNRVFQLGIGYLFEIRSNNTNKIYYY